VSFRRRLRGLVELNAKYGACSMYHTHSGVGQVGASMWDLWLILRDYDPKLVGFNYDIGHATAEGGYGGWIHSLRLAAPYLRGVAVKDFNWGKTNNEWRPRWCPVGEGMVNFPRFFSMLKEIGFDGPLQVHYEYKLGGADTGQTKVEGDPKEILARMKKDLDLLRETARAAYAAG
jgi:sugar phosphate isomerase/epimerase